MGREASKRDVDGRLPLLRDAVLFGTNPYIISTASNYNSLYLSSNIFLKYLLLENYFHKTSDFEVLG